MDIKQYMQGLGEQARQASRAMSAADSGAKNAALLTIAHRIQADREALMAANTDDMVAAKANGLEPALLDRLELTPARIDAMLEGIEQVAALADPVGALTDLVARPSGIQVGKMRVPLGVIGIIYESRPNVTVEAASLCLKSGNAVILRGGSEAFHSNQAIAACVTQGLEAAGLPSATVQLLNTTDRAAVGELLKLHDYVDVIVPRGGKDLIKRVSSETKINVIKHLDGVCHVYVDNKVDLEMAVSVAFNSKSEKYGVCNAMETLLVHHHVAGEFLSRIEPLFAEKGVELRCCPKSHSLCSSSLIADDSDWTMEYLGPVLAIKIVRGLDEAIDNINKFGSHHTDLICK